MKFFEYLYLGGAVALTMLLIQQYDVLETWQKSLLIAGIVVMSFLFSFRRTQRQRQEKRNPNQPES